MLDWIHSSCGVCRNPAKLFWTGRRWEFSRDSSTQSWRNVLIRIKNALCSLQECQLRKSTFLEGFFKYGGPYMCKTTYWEDEIFDKEANFNESDKNIAIHATFPSKHNQPPIQQPAGQCWNIFTGAQTRTDAKIRPSGHVSSSPDPMIAPLQFFSLMFINTVKLKWRQTK